MRFPKIFVFTCSDLSNQEKYCFLCDFQTIISDNMLLYSNFLIYMENFDYRSILVDSGTIVQCWELWKL